MVQCEAETQTRRKLYCCLKNWSGQQKHTFKIDGKNEPFFCVSQQYQDVLLMQLFNTFFPARILLDDHAGTERMKKPSKEAAW